MFKLLTQYALILCLWAVLDLLSHWYVRKKIKWSTDLNWGTWNKSPIFSYVADHTQFPNPSLALWIEPPPRTASFNLQQSYCARSHRLRTNVFISLPNDPQLDCRKLTPKCCCCFLQKLLKLLQWWNQGNIWQSDNPLSFAQHAFSQQHGPVSCTSLHISLSAYSPVSADSLLVGIYSSHDSSPCLNRRMFSFTMCIFWE